MTDLPAAFALLPSGDDEPALLWDLIVFARSQAMSQDLEGAVRDGRWAAAVFRDEALRPRVVEWATSTRRAPGWSTQITRAINRASTNDAGAREIPRDRVDGLTKYDPDLSDELVARQIQLGATLLDLDRRLVARHAPGPIDFEPGPNWEGADLFGYDEEVAEALLHWARSDSAARILTDPNELHRFGVWERQLLRATGVSKRLADSFADDASDALRLVSWSIGPSDLPAFLETMLRSHGWQRIRRRFLVVGVRLRNWLAMLDDGATVAMPDGSVSFASLAVLAANKNAWRVGLQDEAMPSLLASIILAAPGCIAPLRTMIGRQRRVPEQQPIARELLDQAAICAASVLTMG